MNPDGHDNTRGSSGDSGLRLPGFLRTRLSLAARLFFAALFVLVAQHASAQSAGTITAVEPSAEVGRGGVWTAAVAGATLQVGDVLRTGRPGRLSVGLQDESVIVVSDGSELVIDEQLLAPERGTARTVLGLVQGKIRALVSDYYQGRRGGFDVKTPTALAGVRGTDFIVGYDPETEVSEVVGVSGLIAVNSALEPDRNGVVISAHEVTTVARGELPRPPRKLSDTLFRQYIEGFQFLIGSTGGLPLAQSVIAGTSVPSQDTIASAAASPVSSQPLVVNPVPGENPFPMSDQDDKDITSNTSSILGQPAAVIGTSSLGISF